MKTRRLRFGRRGAARAAALLLAIGLAAACGFGKEDTSPEGQRAIRDVQEFRLPLGNTVADGVSRWVYAREDANDEITGRMWHAFRSVGLGGPSYHVAFRYDRVAHGDVPVQEKNQEIRFLYRPRDHAVEPENALARHVMGQE